MRQGRDAGCEIRERYHDLHARLDQLGGKPNRFIQAVERKHNTDRLKEDPASYNE